MSLIEKAKNKDPVAFEQLLKPQIKKLYRIAITMLQNEEDAADAIQETTLKCWEKINQVRNDEYFETWLTRILINKCKDILRKRTRILYMEEVPETRHEEEYFVYEWKDVLHRMEQKYQIVLELFYIDGFSTKEISKMLHISDSAVRTRLARGRRQLEKLVNGNTLQQEG